MPELDDVLENGCIFSDKKLTSFEEQKKNNCVRGVLRLRSTSVGNHKLDILANRDLLFPYSRIWQTPTGCGRLLDPQSGTWSRIMAFCAGVNRTQCVNSEPGPNNFKLACFQYSINRDIYSHRVTSIHVKSIHIECIRSGLLCCTTG